MQPANPFNASSYSMWDKHNAYNLAIFGKHSPTAIFVSWSKVFLFCISGPPNEFTLFFSFLICNEIKITVCCSFRTQHDSITFYPRKRFQEKKTDWLRCQKGKFHCEDHEGYFYWLQLVILVFIYRFHLLGLADQYVLIINQF